MWSIVLSEVFLNLYSTHFIFIIGGALSCLKYNSEVPDSLCCLVVDSGYSFTHIAPYIKGKKVKRGVRRIDVGGKLLTNHLKDIISYR